ncbi:MAG: acyltransferase [Chloroflexi bacterium]|nr:MAG: acyltransferase [Chloroflexota bacterium]
MLNFLPPFLVGSLSASLLILNTLFWCLPLYFIILLKLFPIKAWQTGCTKLIIWLAEMWITCNSGIMWLTQRTEWEVTGLENLKHDDWYLVIANHQSWADIVVMQHVLNRRIPFLKFFIKQELIWVPVIGLAWWGLDFPFMKRYTKEFLKKHPELRGKDMETTREKCEKFKFTPVSVMNYLEGTRFTPAKHAKQQSPYKYLLKPKAGGIALVLSAMNEQIKTMVNITIVYPDGIPSSWDFLSGKVRRIVMQIDKQEIPADYLTGDYQNDPFFREQFQAWVRDLWEEKDEVIAGVLGEKRPLLTQELT